MLITPTMVKIAKLKDASDRRLKLRKLVTPTLEKYWKPDTVRTALRGSRIVGEGAGRIKVRPTPAGVRDALGESTLWFIALMRHRTPEIDRARALILSAILDPDHYGVKSSAKKNKTGFDFGHPALVGDWNLTDWLLAEAECVAERGREPRRPTPGSDFEDMSPELIHVITDASACPDLWVLTDDVPKPADTLETITEEAPIVKRSLIKFTLPADTAQRDLVNFALKSASLPSLEELKAQLDEAGEAAGKVESLQNESEKLRLALAAAKKLATAAPKKVEAIGDLPEGNVNWRNARDVFALPESVKAFDFEVPVWEWEHDHPHVPEVDADYIFQSMPLFGVLRAIVRNDRAWLRGHTGTGKTTLIEQVAAHLNWPVMRVNFDSEISRADLIGRDTITTSEEGASISRFVDGVLPRIVGGPYIGIFDEIDFVRPDVAYVMQSVFEGNGLVVNEDGGRIVRPHPWSRLFATANTCGQGDEFGLYQGARPQSQAMLDRFAAFLTVEYMKADDRRALIKARVPALADDLVDAVNKYATEHIEAFTSTKVMQPLSPRGIVSMAQWVCDYVQLFPTAKRQRALTEALNATLLDRANEQDRAVLFGIAQRVFKIS